MKQYLAILVPIPALMMIAALSACSTTPTPAQVTTDLQAVQTITSALACQGEAVANSVTAGATIAGDTKLATISSASAVATGKLCTGLPLGAPLTPAP
jgi:hypothetical protein